MFGIKKNVIIAVICVVVVLMATGYSLLSTELIISGIGDITAKWDIRIINISQGTSVGKAYNIETPSYTDTMARFYVGLVDPGDSMTYEITIKNEGDISGILNSMEVNSSGVDAIEYEVLGISEQFVIQAGQTIEVTVVARYRTDAGTIDINQRAKRLKISLNWLQWLDDVAPSPSSTSSTTKSITTSTTTTTTRSTSSSTTTASAIKQ